MKTSEETGRYGRFGQEVVSGGSVTAPAAETGGGAAGTIAGVVLLGLLVWLAVVNIWMFVFVVGILVSVFLHEMGHFVTARLTGMKATQYFIGFGPRLWSFHRGETEYGVRALPLGAFVRIIGMSNLDEVPPEDEARTYRQQSYPRRMLVITAGSMMHLVIAIVLLFTVFAIRGEPADQSGVAVAPSANGPASAAGLRTGDVVAAIDGVAVDEMTELGEAVRSHQPGEVVDVELIRDGEPLTVAVGLGSNPDQDDERFGTAFLGVSPRTEFRQMSVAEAAASSVTQLFPTAWDSVEGIFRVFNPVSIYEHLTGESDDPMSRPMTVVGITQLTGDLGDREGIIGVLLVLAGLNVFVGVFNMFPLLPLDGGHAAVATYERLRERNGKRYFADVSKLMPFAMAVIVALLFVFMSGLYLELVVRQR